MHGSSLDISPEEYSLLPGFISIAGTPSPSKRPGKAVANPQSSIISVSPGYRAVIQPCG